MSTPEPPLPTRLASTTNETVPTVRRALGGLTTGLTATVRAVAFWVAALLPLSYLPLLATGFVGEHALVFCGLIALNAVGLVVGSGHETA